jgi:hypothetical protein
MSRTANKILQLAQWKRSPDEEVGRNVSISFESIGETTKVTETFDPEHENPEEMQRAGWQAILENFKKYVEFN